MAVMFISIGRMPFLALTLDNTDMLFTLMVTPGFYGMFFALSQHH